MQSRNQLGSFFKKITNSPARIFAGTIKVETMIIKAINCFIHEFILYTSGKNYITVKMKLVR